MLRNARFVPILLTAWVAPAIAADCLNQADNISVEFDLPAAQSMFASPNDPNYIAPPSDQPFKVPPPPTMTPPGRPGALHEVTGGGSFGSAPIAARDRLSAAKRDKVVTILRQARLAEALGNEPKCFELLREAQAITKENG